MEVSSTVKNTTDNDDMKDVTKSNYNHTSNMEHDNDKERDVMKRLIPGHRKKVSYADVVKRKIVNVKNAMKKK